MDSIAVPPSDLMPVPLTILAHAALWLRLEAATRHELEQRQHLESAADNLQAAIDRWAARRPVQGA